MNSSLPTKSLMLRRVLEVGRVRLLVAVAELHQGLVRPRVVVEHRAPRRSACPARTRARRRPPRRSPAAAPPDPRARARPGRSAPGRTRWRGRCRAARRAGRSRSLGRDRHRPEVRLQAHLLGELDEQVLVGAPAVAAHDSHSSNVVGVELAPDEPVLVEQSREHRRRRLDPLDRELAQRPPRPRETRLAVRPPDDQLAEQRVVERRDLDAGLEPRVDPHPRPRRPRRPPAPCPGEGMNLFAGSSAFSRSSSAQPRVSNARQLAGQLRRDEVDAGHQLGDGMLDLDPRVHLDEEVLAGLVVDEELERPRAAVADRPRQRCRGRAQIGRVVGRRGRLLDHLLAPPLQRALALAQRDVAEHLHLDVPRALDEPLDVDAARRRTRRRASRAARVERLAQLRLVGGDPDPAPAAARRGLDRDRVLLGRRDRGLVDVGDRAVGARHDRHAGVAPPPRAPPPCRPSARCAPASGPTNVRPASSTARANAAFSARNP